MYSKMPHLVTLKKNGGMACDKECPQYQSAGLCSHVVAAAKYRRILLPHKVCRKPNFTKLVTCDMPKGRVAEHHQRGKYLLLLKTDSL